MAETFAERLASTELTFTSLDDAVAGLKGSTAGMGRLRSIRDVVQSALDNVSVTGGSISGITDLAVADGGTGASTAGGARTNLGLAIGTNVQAWDADLDNWAQIKPVVQAFSSRSDVTTATIIAQVTHLRTAGYAASGDGGGAVYARAASEPAHALKVQSADGAWWELVPEGGAIDVRQAGAVGDDATDDGQAFIDAINGVADFNASGVDKATHAVLVSPGSYYLGANTLELKRVVTLYGTFGGWAAPPPAQLRWDANVTGIIVHDRDTIGATVEGTPTGTGSSSVIQGLQLLGSGGNNWAGVTDDTEGHGIWLRATATIRDCVVKDFDGNGIHILAAAGEGGAREGNANSWRIDTCRVIGCRNGLYIEGADTNQGISTRLDTSINARWGIVDNSFLGNKHDAPHAATNGRANKAGNPIGSDSFVDFGGVTYVANVNATEAELVNTEPGTDDTIWTQVDTVSIGTTWQSGQSEGTYFHGGCYHSSANGAHNKFDMAYVENDCAPAQLIRPSMYFAGEGRLPIGFYGGMGVDQNRSEIYGVTRFRNSRQFSPARELDIEFNGGVNILSQLKAEGDDSLGLRVQWDEGQGAWIVQHGASHFIRYTTGLNSLSYGRASALGGGQIVFPKGVFIGGKSDGGGQGARWHGNDTAAPTTGEHAQGDIVWNQSPTVQTDSDTVNWIVQGWMCTAGGTPGTWQTMWVRVSNPPGL